ncbi:enoyl-CoA hydratase/isomerase family protein [Athalassotoga saccharophila]|uniref:enoyl-CoA hydratase/isomerase family protein n=1 Tax=Athalassotoga saccharophila TaxID=1441386 RepID=UPI001379FDD7|nr:enoyl-CoA hydratase-related protein [Athalassotoga saccharophila]BBJ28375.1 enoyl-CoA hydratase [Athalassotoga saccharophila]
MSEIIVEKKEKIGFIILNRPEAQNTFNLPFAEQLNDGLKRMDADDKIRVVIIKANGRNFSAGIDLREFGGKTHEEYRKTIKIMDEHNHTIPRMKKPVIAQVQGYALANGAGLVFACDMAIAGESAKFGTTAINVGLICLGPAVPLSRLVGRKKVLEMVLTGEIMDAREAYRIGLVNKVVPDEELESETLKLANILASKSALALQTGKEGIYKMQDIPYHDAADYMSELFANLASTKDGQEGIKAFLEKRPPEFRGL